MKLICATIGVVCLLVRGLGIPTGQIDLGWLGLAFIAAAMLIF